MTSVDSLTKIGFDPALAEHVVEYVNRLNENDANGPGLRHGGRYMHFDVDENATKANKYVRIVSDTSPGDKYGKAVHAFIVKSTGMIVKAAGWAGPAKSTAAGKKGELLSNYTLTDEDSRTKLWNELATNPSAWSGGYLYQR